MVDLSFPANWQIEVLAGPPMIAPARQFVYPAQVPGEEDALVRGALYAMVRPVGAGAFLAVCALGFADASMPSGVWSCPNPDEMCAVAGGYAYIVDTQQPERCFQVPLRPATSALPAPEHRLLLFVGFHAVIAVGAAGVAWQTKRLSWEGVRVSGIEGCWLRGFGWDLMADKEVPFAVDLLSGEHTGGAAPGA